MTLALTVQPTAETINETICEGESYVLGNNTYSQSGTYVEDIVTGAGCNTQVTLNLEVAENPVVDIEETICAGESYVVGTNTYNQSGTYSDVISTTMGCDSTVNLTLTVSTEMETSIQSMPPINSALIQAFHRMENGSPWPATKPAEHPIFGPMICSGKPLPGSPLEMQLRESLCGHTMES